VGKPQTKIFFGALRRILSKMFVHPGLKPCRRSWSAVLDLGVIIDSQQLTMADHVTALYAGRAHFNYASCGW